MPFKRNLHCYTVEAEGQSAKWRKQASYAHALVHSSQSALATSRKEAVDALSAAATWRKEAAESNAKMLIAQDEANTSRASLARANERASAANAKLAALSVSPAKRANGGGGNLEADSWRMH